MKYTIEIAHANDVINNQWKAVDQFNKLSELADHIESPIFDWQRTTCVRVVDRDKEYIYTGIFGDSQCIDVGSKSDVSRAHSWFLDKFAKSFCEDRSFIDNWITSPTSTWMLYAIRHLVPMKTMMEFAVHCIQIALEYDESDDEEVLDAMSGLQAHLNDEITYRDLDKLRNAVVTSENYSDFIHSAINAACMIPSGNIEYATTSVLFSMRVIADDMMEANSSSDQVKYIARAELKFANLLRETIPFYDIAYEITK